MNDSLDILRGVAAIAAYLGEGHTERQVRYLIERKMIPVFREGHCWCARKSTLRQHYERLESSAVAA